MTDVTRSPKRRARDVDFMLKKFYPDREQPDAITECVTDLMHLAERDNLDMERLTESAAMEFQKQRKP